MLPLYVETLTVLRQAHRSLLEIIDDELRRNGRGIITAHQALLLHGLGDETLQAKQLRSHAHYLGSNVTYNLHKLVRLGYVERRRSKDDGRSVRVTLTDKGRVVRDLVEALFTRHALKLEQLGDVNAGELKTIAVFLRRFDRFFTEQMLYRC